MRLCSKESLKWLILLPILMLLFSIPQITEALSEEEDVYTECACVFDEYIAVV